MNRLTLIPLSRDEFLSSWESEVDKFFNQFYDDFQPTPTSQRGYPKLDIYREENNLVIETAIPFARKEDINLTLFPEKDYKNLFLLTISGETREKYRKEGMVFAVKELKRGKFKRCLHIEKSVVDKCPSPEANMENGILTIIFRNVYEPEKLTTIPIK